LAGVLLVLATRWPFTRGATIESLEQVFASEVHIPRFEKTFFPNPGYIAENVTFTRGEAPGVRPIASIRKITCRASWLALITFTHRIKRMDLVGLKIYIPAHVPPPVRKHEEPAIKTTVTDLFANGTMLEFAPRHPGGQTIRFEFPELAIGNVAKDKSIHFRAKVQNPNPPGELRVSGAVGPLKMGRIGETEISGSFRLLHADLGAYKVIAGDLSGGGRFNGTLRQAQIAGNATIPNFEVTSSRHSLGLTAEYRAVVNGTNGDVAVESAQAHFRGTTLNAHGTISGAQGKTVRLDFDSRESRIEDLLRLFVTADEAPLNGPITLSAHVVLPPTHRPFIKRVQLDGGFSITDADFTNPSTQEKVDELSARARGRKDEVKTRNGPPRITEDFKGEVNLRNGIATVRAASFVVPGAVARGGGTYDITTEGIDLRGNLAMHVSISKAASGIKSVLLIPLDPFFKKNGESAVLPVRVSGTYSHPVFKVSLRR